MSEVSSGSVTTWIELLKAGDHDAASRLWDRYFQRLLELARSKMRDLPRRATDEEDVALSVFHAVYQAAAKERLPNVNSRDDLWTMLVVITAGKVVDTRRREYALKRGGNRSPLDGATTSRNLPSDALTPSDVLEELLCRELDPAFASLLEEEFQHLLRKLADPDLERIALSKLEGYTHAEIAEQMQCHERTIKRKLALIRKIWETSDGN